MTLIVDTASAARRLVAEEFRRWAETRTIFLSSEMRELSALRGRIAGALREAGFSVVIFEDLGGRDEDAKRAYLDGVARSDVYVGVLADRYGTMLPSGRSPTHEEYLEARRLGKRISFWLAREARDTSPKRFKPSTRPVNSLMLRTSQDACSSGWPRSRPTMKLRGSRLAMLASEPT
ncbi:MAG TPA: DUF4062 domain-containing protein [Solirubrobacteraceae bacterium]|jgi:hypothetical protein|nr:DUF4062 domain-containing protein [Solirubrobacteraceae bacterium]